MLFIFKFASYISNPFFIFQSTLSYFKLKFNNLSDKILYTYVYENNKNMFWLKNLLKFKWN